MLAFLSGLVTIMKGVDSLRVIGESFYILWVEHDLNQLGSEAEARKEELDVLNLKFKQSQTDAERRALIRSIGRLR